jgi:hypothetical protein
MCESLVSSPHCKVGREGPPRLLRAAWIACLLILSGGAQNSPVQNQGQFPRPPSQRPDGAQEGAQNNDSIEEERRLRTLNAERQRTMVADTAKLLRLAKELNAEIESAQPAALNSSQLHKVGEIEKLAHGVKDKMSTSVRGIPVFSQPPPLWQR